MSERVEAIYCPRCKTSREGFSLEVIDFRGVREPGEQTQANELQYTEMQIEAEIGGVQCRVTIRFHKPMTLEEFGGKLPQIVVETLTATAPKGGQ